MNRLELRTLIRKRLGETTSSFWSDTELNTWINLGCQDISQRTRCLRTKGYISTTAVEENTSATILSEWTLSTNFPNLIAITEVHFHEQGTNWSKMQHMYKDDLDLQYDGWRDAVGRSLSEPITYNYDANASTPFIYWWDYEEDLIGLYPPCDSQNATSNNLMVHYAYNHGSVASDTNSPTLPIQLHLPVIDFVVATGFETRGLQDKANDAWEKYFKRITDYEINRQDDREDDDLIMKPHRSV